MIVKEFDDFINEMYMGPADGKASVKAFNDKQQKLTHNPNAVSSDPSGFGNGGNAGAPVGENDSPSMMSDRLGDLEPDGYPSGAGHRYPVSPQESPVMSHNNMRGEPKLTTIQR